MASATVLRLAPALVEAGRHMSCRQIRNRATLGGNIVSASPAADAVPPLLAANANLLLCGPDGRREVPLAEFLTGPGKTSLRQGEVLLEVRIPARNPNCRSHYVKVGRRKAMASSIINLAANIDIGPDGLIRDLRIALGAVAPTAMRARRAEKSLTGRAPNAKNLAEAAAMAAEECRPISDIRATSDGRRLLVQVWTLRLLQVLCEKSGATAGGRKS
jgi:CO/xanthine dehydrogenase FAD-binding subunit